MSRCQHCDKLTHNQHMNVYINIEDMEKLEELQSLASWNPAFSYNPKHNAEYGKLKLACDIVLHFILLSKEKEIK